MPQLYGELEKQLALIARNLREPTVLADGTVVHRSTASVLYLLAEHETMRVGAVASALNLDPSTTTRQVQHAERLGLVARVEDPRDRRAGLLTLTTSGRELHDRLVERQRGGLRELLDGWTEKDRTDLVRLLSSLNEEMAARRDLAVAAGRGQGDGAPRRD